MADSSGSTAEADELLSKLQRLISARKKYPHLIMNIERSRQHKELISEENIQTELDDDDVKEIQLEIADIKTLAKNLANCQSSFKKTEELYARNKKNLDQIENFLEFRKTFGP